MAISTQAMFDEERKRVSSFTLSRQRHNRASGPPRACDYPCSNVVDEQKVNGQS
jgi:hypothetical protein